jgi:signal transduction histidine kinase
VLDVPGAEADASNLANQTAASRRAQTRGDLRGLLDEQAALRRVAELVARGASQPSVFEAVAHEASGLLGGHFTSLLRYEPDGAAVIVAMWGAEAVRHVRHVGMRLSQDGDGLVQRVQRTGRAERLESYEGVPGSNATTARDLGLTSGVGAPIITEGRVWGAITVLGAGPSLPASAEARLERFAKLVATAIANAQARAGLAALANEQAALRRVAELVARGAAPREIFAAVATEASQLLDDQAMTLVRYEGQDELVVVASCGGPAPVGERIRFEAETLPDRVRREAGVVRVDDYTREPDRSLAASYGLAAAVAAPVSVEAEVWGMLTATSSGPPLAPGTEQRLQEFAELVAAALAASQARTDLQTLADEQAALRRVAELVARGAALDEVFAAVAAEASKLLGDVAAALLRYEPGDLAVVVAVCNSSAPLGLRIPSDSETATGEVLRTGRAVRVDSLDGTQPAQPARERDARAGLAVPVTVEGRVWGALATSTAGPTLPPGAEQRLAQFAELAAAAIANAENKAKLTASRARVVATADETRRRLQRDVHDSAQQRLVHTIITLKLARNAIAAREAAGELVEEALTNAERANAELRDVVRGILPAALTRGGLRAGLESLVADLAVPVDLRVTAPRLSTQLETTAYFVVAEALTNVVKHARATRATVEVEIEAQTLAIYVRDDGAGAADPARGTGLTGMLDRVEASQGTLQITSPAGIGTTLHATLPLGEPMPGG